MLQDFLDEIHLFPLHWCLPGSHSVCVVQYLPALTQHLLFDLASEKAEMQKLHFWEETLCAFGLCNWLVHVDVPIILETQRTKSYYCGS